jgi:hypothetical protein
VPIKKIELTNLCADRNFHCLVEGFDKNGHTELWVQNLSNLKPFDHNKGLDSVLCSQYFNNTPCKRLEFRSQSVVISGVFAEARTVALSWLSPRTKTQLPTRHSSPELATIDLHLNQTKSGFSRASMLFVIAL